MYFPRKKQPIKKKTSNTLYVCIVHFLNVMEKNRKQGELDKGRKTEQPSVLVCSGQQPNSWQNQGLESNTTSYQESQLTNLNLGLEYSNTSCFNS